MPASLIRAARGQLPTETLATVFTRGVTCGRYASRVLGDLVETHVPHPSQWRYSPRDVYDCVHPFIQVDFDSFSDRLFGAYARYRSIQYFLMSPEQKADHAKAISDAWAVKSEEEKATHAKAISDAWAAKSDEEKAAICQLQSKVKADWWATLSDEQKRHQQHRMAEGWSNVSQEDKDRYARAQSDAWQNLPEEQKQLRRDRVKEGWANQSAAFREHLGASISQRLANRSDEERHRISDAISRRWQELPEDERTTIKGKISDAWRVMDPHRRQKISLMHSQRLAKWSEDKKKAFRKKISMSWEALSASQRSQRQLNIGKGVKRAWAAKPRKEVAACGEVSRERRKTEWKNRDSVTRGEIIQRGLSARKAARLKSFEERIRKLHGEMEPGKPLVGGTRASVRKSWNNHFKDNPGVSALTRESVDKLLGSSSASTEESVR